MKRLHWMMLFALLLLSVSSVYAAEPVKDENLKEPVPAKQVAFFDAIDQGLIEATIVPRNSLSGRVTVKSKSDVPLNIELPPAFGAVHLAQWDDGGGSGSTGRRSGSSSRGGSSRGGSNSGSGRGGGNQSMGGGWGGGGGGGWGSGGGGGMWNLAPEAVLRQEVKTVCLEHGKGEPRPSNRYELRPIETVTEKTEVKMLCALVGAGAVDQTSAQAAVWHYNCGMSWEELASKTTRAGAGKPFVSYFKPEQINNAMQLGKKVEAKVAEEMKENKTKSPDTVY